MDFLRTLTPEFFDTLIVVVILIGVAMAAVRLYADFTRPLSPPRPTRPPLDYDQEQRP